jgi:hypothetical protein
MIQQLLLRFVFPEAFFSLSRTLNGLYEYLRKNVLIFYCKSLSGSILFRNIVSELYSATKSLILLVGRSPDRFPVVSLGIFSEESDKSMCPGSTQPFEMGTMIFLGVKTSGADNLTTLMCRLSRNPGSLTSQTPQGHVGLFRGYFTLIFY